MSKNLIVILYFSLAAIGLLILAAAAIFAPLLVESLFQQVVQVLGLASTAAIAIYLLGTQSKDIAEVKAQTNGTLSALREENARLNQQLLSVVGSAPPSTQPQD